ncbi:hypothetical protein DNY73_20005 [Salmonella enterica subsp. diarizonae]|nr:hypothetical protein [Salmonella enterica subsp. diarizonae]
MLNSIRIAEATIGYLLSSDFDFFNQLTSSKKCKKAIATAQKTPRFIFLLLTQKIMITITIKTKYFSYLMSSHL